MASSSIMTTLDSQNRPEVYSSRVRLAYEPEHFLSLFVPVPKDHFRMDQAPNDAFESLKRDFKTFEKNSVPT